MRRKSAEQLRSLIEEALNSRTIAVVDASGSPSSQAYEGLRAAVTDAAQTRRVHLAQLTELDRALRASSTLDGPKLLLEDMMSDVGLERIEDSTRVDLFEEINSEGNEYAVSEAAYIDSGTGRVVRKGRFRLVATTD